MKNKQTDLKISGLSVITVLFILFLYSSVDAQDVVWTQTDNPGNGQDVASCVTADSDYIYVGGYIGQDPDFQWRIQKRNKIDGSVVWTQTENPSGGGDFPRAIISDDQYLYIVGSDGVYRAANGQYYQEWRIEKRNKSDGSMIWAKTEDFNDINNDWVTDITCDNDYIYVVGIDYTPLIQPIHGFYPQWRIEKRNKSDGNIVWVQTEDPSPSFDWANTVACDNDYIYVAGHDSIPGAGNYQWRIEKRNKSNGSLLWVKTEDLSNFSDSVNDIALDEQYLYLAGQSLTSDSNTYQWRIQKRTKSTGDIIWTQEDDLSTGHDFADSITQDDTYIYITGRAYSETQWVIQKRKKYDGSIIWYEKEDPSPGYDGSREIASDNNYLYVVGWDAALGNFQWRIQKRLKATPYVDIGLRAYDGKDITHIACEPTATSSSPLRIRKASTTYGIVLVDASDPRASTFKIKTNSGNKHLRKLAPWEK